MRSNKAAQVGQECLWDEPTDAVPARTPGPVARQPRRRSSGRSAAVELFDPSGVHRLESDEFTASGWPAGSLLHLSPASRAARGELVVIREAGQTKVGWFGADRGRPALLTDRGSVWLSERARVVARVLAVEATLVAEPSPGAC